jgi:membrane carboxypeptidase/penicillin-binding protein
LRPTSTYLRPPPGYRFRRPWYFRPWFYVPVAILAVAALFVTVFFSSVVFDLKAQANGFDLNKLEQMESASVILDRNGKIFGQIYVENRETVPYEKLAPDLINGVIAVEDAKFYEHHGYDLLGIIRAALKNLTAGHVRQGGSTITQQLARNSFALKERTYRRKLLEIFLAKRIEDNFSKQKILELYLNRIYFGGGMYGAEAAARGYFGKSARDMTLAECATLAGLIKSPNRLSPWSERTNSRETRDFALDRMRDNGFITREQCAAARAEKIAVGSRQNAQGQTYAVDYIRQQVIAAVGWDRAINEGYRIHTTIDVDLQRVAEDSLKAHLEQVEKHPDYNHQTYADYAASFRKAKSSGKMAEQPAPEYLQGAAIGLDNASGDILVLVGGRDFEHNQFNRALQARRPAGTAMLPFVYATAFERGMYPGSVVEDSPLDNRAVMIGGTTGILGEWGPEDADNQYEGRDGGDVEPWVEVVRDRLQHTRVGDHEWIDEIGEGPILVRGLATVAEEPDVGVSLRPQPFGRSQVTVDAHIRQLLIERQRDEIEARVIGGRMKRVVGERACAPGSRDRTDLERARSERDEVVGEIRQLRDAVARERDGGSDGSAE